MAYSLKEINDAVRSDPKGFAEACDAAFAKKVETAAQKIADHRKESRIILLSGPSGSGKTTTALKIEEQLEKMGIQTHTISMDNYFNTIDPETAPRNREGAIDYESPFCLDIELLNRHFSMLDRGGDHPRAQVRVRPTDALRHPVSAAEAGARRAGYL